MLAANNPMTDVIYLVKKPISLPPTLSSDRYFDQDLTFALGSGSLGLSVVTNTPTTILDSSNWAVGVDFFNPGTSVWTLDLENGATTTNKLPELVKTSGGFDDLGLPF